MPPMRKSDLDKAAWAWCNNVEPENISDENILAAYRLNISKCGFSKCRRNCRGNPFCLNGLGESKWMSDPVEELDDDDLNIEYRKPLTFVGLRNLGATCYINSLLQLWFHNIAFRNAILRWNPSEEPTDNSVITHLQFLFTLMQFGKKKSVDPSDFVNSLDIDVSTQQDAREFSQLFISYLEDFLKRQSDPVVRNVVNNNFQGHYNYVTRCSKCKTESIRESMFYELEVNVKGHHTLDESIAEFLREEMLEGADMYSCGVCHSKQEATRHIELTALPPVFNLQLIRFIYDRQKGMKKKLNTPLQFPENLDMGPYLKKTDNGENPPSVMYNLFAVLIHKGPSANSGHYVAHICDQTSGSWYMFNDESTQKIEGKKLKLNSDDDYEVDEGAKKQKVGKAIKGHLSSSNAYMLVYTANNSSLDKTPLTEESLQQHLKSKLYEYNETFDSIISQSREEKRTKIEDENLMKAEMASFLNTLPVTDNNNWEAISIKWLINWIAANRSSGFYPIDNNHFTCSHDKINPDSVSEFKFINKEVADNIYEKYGGGPRLDKNSLCKECVKLICLNIRSRTKISNDQKELSNLLKAKENIEMPAFWVGKESLRTWKAKAMKQLDKGRIESCDDDKMESTPASYSTPDTVSSSIEDPSNSTVQSMTSSEYPFQHSSKISYNSSNNFYAKRKRPKIYLNKLLIKSQELKENLDRLISFIINNPCPESLPGHLMHDTFSSLSLFYPELKKHSSIRNDSDVLAPMETVNNCVSCNNNLETKFGHEKTFLTETMEENSSQKENGNEIYNGSNETNVSDLYNNISHQYNTQNHPTEAASLDTPSQFDANPENIKKTKTNSDEEKERECSDDGKVNGNKSEEDEDEEYEFDFNEDIICSHGNLCVEESSRRLVSEQAWTILRSYFPDCREFIAEYEPCLDCQCLVSEGKVAKDLHKQQALKEKELLGNLYMGKNRPKDPWLGIFHILSVPDFLEPWRKFLREPTRREPLTSIRNNNLVCCHEGLLYNPVQPEDFDKLVLITDEEWDKLSTHFKIDREITLEFRENGEIISHPAVCSDCVAARLDEEQKALLKYTNAKVYIRQLVKASQEDNPPVCPNPNQKCSDAYSQIRRSSRNKRNKGEKVFTVSSDQTLLNLKLQILNWLEVAPFDQHLILEDGKELVDHDATLSSLNVFPNSVIYLKIDEPEDISPGDEVVRKKQKFEPEHGFKGTGLLKR